MTAPPDGGDDDAGDRRRRDRGEPRRGTRLELTVGPVAHGGHCVARHEGRAVFVRHALPGEHVIAVVTEGGGDDPYWRADAVEVLVASPDRVRAPCRYARPGGCGGCDWQHAALPAQRRLKAAVIAEQLRHHAGLEVTGLVVEPVPGDVDGLRWRTRMRFAVDEAGRAGLHPHRSDEVLPIDRCAIAHPLVTSVHAERYRWPARAAVEVAGSGTGERMVVVSPSGGGAAGPLPRLDRDVSVVLVQGGERSKLRGRTRLTERAGGRTWKVSGDGFWQVHPGAADALVGAVVDVLRPAPGERALDLYAGAGLFAGVLAGLVGPAGEVVAVEADRRAVADARRNLHGLDHVRIVRGRADRVLRDLGPGADIVVLDPPRSGAGKAVCQAVARLRPRAVGYVACDPVALARDVALLAGLGYRLDELRAFDLFPMTHHVECVAAFVPGSQAAGG